MGYNVAPVRDICEIFCVNRGFRGRAVERCTPHFPPTDPCCHRNKIRDKMGYNSASVKDTSRIFSCSCSGSNTLAVVVVVVVVVSASHVRGMFIRLVTI